MTVKQQQAAIKELTPHRRNLYRAIAQYGPISAPQLRDPLDLDGGGEWPGRNPGSNAGTHDLRALLFTGLIHIETEKFGKQAATYVATDARHIEREAGRYRRKQQPKRKSAETLNHSKIIAGYRAQEKKLGPTARAHWLERRRRVVELAQTLRRVEPMLYWKAADDDELEQVWEEITDLIQWAISIESSLDVQRLDKKARERIANLRNTNGRGEIEAATARKLADREEEKLEIRIASR